MSVFLQNTIERIEKVGKILRIPSQQLEVIKKPQKVIKKNLQIKLDNGKKKTCKAYRVQHNDALGPFKGGIRFHPEVSLEEVSALAALMTLKNSAVGIPYGGGKGGIRIDAKRLSNKETELLSRAYAKAMHKDIGPDKDIPAPDVGTDERTMAWMADEYSRLSKKHVPGSFTGKPVILGGSRGRDIATSFGGAVVLEEFLKNSRKHQQKKPRNVSVAVQGFGNVGANTARILFEKGYKIVAVSGSQGGIYDSKGLDVRAIIAEMNDAKVPKQNSSLDLRAKKYQGKTITNEVLLELDVDVLIPAALEDQIKIENAKDIKAKVILELANGPVTGAADALLAGKGVAIIPDIVANAGGVVGSYFEWVQNRTGEQWEEQAVLAKIAKVMKDAFRQVAETQKLYEIDLRTASYVMALQRVQQAMALRGRL